MLWRRSSSNPQKLEAEIHELRTHIKQLEGQNRQLKGQVTIYKAARDFMNLLFYKISECVLITDDKGRIMKASQRMQDLIGYPESELTGKYTVEISARVDDLLKNQEAAFERKAHKQDVENFESFLRHKNGTEVPVTSHITFVHDESGKHLGAVAVIRKRI